MALRLNDLVVCGEIYNTRKYSVHGWLQLRGHDRPVLLQLTGDCSPDLAGQQIRFEARDADSAGPDADENLIDLSTLAWQQVGPTGTMTAARMVDVLEGPFELNGAANEPPRTQKKRCLYLEWFSQNGRVVIELVDPIIGPPEPELPEDSGEPAEGPWQDLELGSPLELEPGDDTFDELSIDESEEDDPYRLIPDELQEQFDSQASEVDRLVGPPGLDDCQELRELELMDALIESGPGEPVGTIFDSPMKLPRPEALNDVEVEQALKSLLAQLALFGIALDVCKHFTPRAAYELLLEHICRQEYAYPQLRQTQWVQHFMTSEFCPDCEAEFDREYEQDKSEDPPGDEPPADDIPF